MQLNLIPGMVYCPRTVCNSYIISDPDSDLAVCDTCGFPFCKLCRQTWHGLGRCTVFDKIKARTPFSSKFWRVILFAY